MRFSIRNASDELMQNAPILIQSDMQVQSVIHMHPSFIYTYTIYYLGNSLLFPIVLSTYFLIDHGFYFPIVYQNTGNNLQEEANAILSLILLWLPSYSF